MAQIDDLLNQASEIRDAEQDKENTALRVGQMLIAIIQHIASFVTVEGLAAALEDYAPLVGNLVDWRHSRVVPLYSMGQTIDNVDGGDWVPGTLPVGAIVYDSTHRNLRYKKDTETSEDYPCLSNIIYINLHTRRLYTFNATDGMVELSSEPVQRRIINNMNVANANDLNIGEVGYVPLYHKLRYKYAANGSIDFPVDPNAIYCDASSNTTIRWNESAQEWVVVGSSSSGSGNVTITEDSDYVYINIDNSTPVPAVPTLVVSKSVINMSNDNKTATFVVSGSNLTGNVSISVDGQGFSVSPTMLSPVNGTLSETTVTVTYSGTTDQNGTISVSSSGATPKTIGVSYGVAPVLTVSKNSMSFATEPGVAVSDTFHVSGSNLTGNVTIAVTGSGLAALPASLSPQNGVVDADITVNYAPSSSATPGSSGGNITVSSTGAESKTIGVSMSVSAAVTPDANGRFQKGGIYYEVISGTQTVKVYNQDYDTSNASTTRYSGDIVIPSTVVAGGTTYTVVEIADMAFAYCPDLTSIKLPNTVTTIGKRFGSAASVANSSLVDVDFGGVVVFGNSQVQYNYILNNAAITSVKFPDTVTIIHNGNIQGCTNLTTVDFGASVVRFTGLFDVTKNPSITSVRTVICRGATPPGPNNGANTSFQFSSDVKAVIENVYVPRAYLDTYKSNTLWSDFNDGRLKALEDMETE